MKFYSYDYVLSQVSQANWLLGMALFILFALTIVVAIQAYRDKRDSKYRELVIILVLGLIVIVLSAITNLEANSASDDQYRTSLHFIEIVSTNLQVDKSEVYVNTSAATDGAIVFVNGDFYRAIRGSEEEMYLLEKMELYAADIELVEVAQ